MNLRYNKPLKAAIAEENSTKLGNPKILSEQENSNENKRG